MSDVLTALLPCDTASPAETEAVGRRLAEVLQPGDVLALYGDLGAGKTHLVKGLCAALGVPAAHVNSPTFTLVNVYDAAFPIYHLDAYRIEHLDELHEMGYEEYVYGDGLCVVEWPARMEPLLPDHTLRLRLTHQGGNRRSIDLVT